MQEHTTQLPLFTTAPSDPAQEIPYGYCHCGCGQKTKLAPQTATRLGWVRGEPIKFVNNHHARIKRILPEGPNPTGLCMCGCGQPTRLAPQTAKKYGWVRGKPMRYIDGHVKRTPAEERFWYDVAKAGPNDCWLWTGRLTHQGYGQFSVNKRNIHAHRFAYILIHGPIANSKLLVCHSCDNPRCVNPAHLWLGSAQDNVSDMLAKGRANPAKGEKHWAAKLTDEQVVQIRQLYATGSYRQIDLGDMFGVSGRYISNLVLHTRRK